LRLRGSVRGWLVSLAIIRVNKPSSCEGSVERLELVRSHVL
jgi:hypothetical protein